MSGIGAKLSWKTWFRIHAKAIAQAIPISFLLVVESRDMYYRSTWQVQQLPPEFFQVGDVIAISNRWYTLPTWNHVLYSFLSKVLLKSCWDDVAVVTSTASQSACNPSSSRNHQVQTHSAETTDSPKILFCDFVGTHEVSLDEFVAMRRPRGLAVRRLQRYPHSESTSLFPSSFEQKVKKLDPHMAHMFKEEVVKLDVHPWYLFRASARLGHENKYYEFCVAMHEQRVKIRNMVLRTQSQQAISVQKKKLHDMEIMRTHLMKFTKPEKEFFLFNGSLVASFFATYGLLDRVRPPPSRYVPQDFARSLPFIGSTELSEPIVFYRP